MPLRRVHPTLVCVCAAICLAGSPVGVGGAPGQMEWSAFRKGVQETNKLLDALADPEDRPVLVPMCQHGPNNQLMQLMASAALARYTASSLFPVPIKGHDTETDARAGGAPHKWTPLSTVVDAGLLSRYVHVATPARVARSASASRWLLIKAFAEGNSSAPKGSEGYERAHAPCVQHTSSEALLELGLAARLRKQRRELGPEHRDTLQTAYRLGNWMAHSGMLPEAAALLRGTLATQRRILETAPGLPVPEGGAHPDTRRTLQAISSLNKWTKDAEAFLSATLVHRVADTDAGGLDNGTAGGFGIALPNQNNTILLACGTNWLTYQSSASFLRQLTGILGRVHARGGLVVVPLFLGMSPFGGISATTPAAVRSFISTNVWARINFDLFRYYSPAPRMASMADDFIRRRLPQGYIAVHLRVSDECMACLRRAAAKGSACTSKKVHRPTRGRKRDQPPGLELCFAPAGRALDEPRFWQRLQELAAEANASHIFVASVAGIEKLASPALWPKNAVTSSPGASGGLSSFEVSVLEQTVCMRARVFVYTASSRLGRKRILGDGSVDVGHGQRGTKREQPQPQPRPQPQPQPQGGKRKGKGGTGTGKVAMKLPPNTSTWAMVVMLYRIVQVGAAARNVAIETLLGYGN